MTNAIAEEIIPIVGDSGICYWDNLTLDWREQIERVNGTQHFPSVMVYPNSVAQLASVMRCAYSHNWRVIPCGNGSKLGWGGVGKPVDIVVSTQRLNQVIDHAVGDLTVTAQAGLKFAQLQEILLKTGQFLPLEPAYPQAATLGGIIATADSGSSRQRYGGVRDMLLGISFVRSDGQVAKAGGRVVKNVAGYDLMKLFTGAYGTLGIITEVTLRLYPVQEASGTVVLTGDGEAIANTAKILLASALTPTAADLLSTGLVTKLGLGEGMGLMVRFQSVSESVREQSDRLIAVGQQFGVTGNFYSDPDEANLWQSLPKQIWSSSPSSEITCKIGVLPTTAINTLIQLDNLTSGKGLGLIHAGSGLGKLRLDTEMVTVDMIQALRQYCESQSGFLTILDAPVSLKEKVDVWGYNGNAINLIQAIKQKFDPTTILSPYQFVGC